MSGRWGRGGMVGVNKAIWKHEMATRIAEQILAAECGLKHQPGTHDLCPRCRQQKGKNDH